MPALVEARPISALASTVAKERHPLSLPSRVGDFVRSLSRVQRELAILGIAAFLGFVVMPGLTWAIGIVVFKTYAGGNNVFALYANFYKALAKASPVFWLVAVGPFILITVARLLIAVFRGGSREPSAEEAPKPKRRAPPAEERRAPPASGRREPSLNADIRRTPPQPNRAPPDARRAAPQSAPDVQPTRPSPRSAPDSQPAIRPTRAAPDAQPAPRPTRAAPGAAPPTRSAPAAPAASGSSRKSEPKPGERRTPFIKSID